MDERCFALGSARVCRILTVYECKGEECPFFKTKSKFDSKQRLANIRLRRLPQEQQTHIADKYYSGQMPWKEGKV